MTLYGAPNNFRTFEVLIAAKYGKVDVPYIQNTGDSSKFSFAKLPCFECQDGQILTGSHAIAKFLAKSSLTVKNNESDTESQFLKWLELVDKDLVPNVLAWLLPSVSAIQIDKKHLDDAKAEVLRLLLVLDKFLLPRTFLVGERLSLADIAVSCALLPLFQHLLEAKDRQKFANLTRWFETCVNQPNFVQVLGTVQMCTKASQFDIEKFEKFQESTKGQNKTATAPKKEKDKSAAKPKDKKEEEPEELDAAEQALAQEPKQTDPFVHLPKSAFNLEEFKRVYSNEDTLTKALPYFWEHFDSSGYSIWRCEYKFADELTLAFMSCNLISGMFQRLDKLRKNAFASVCLFGTDNKSTISGVWVWRGQDLIFNLSEDWKVDFESYNWEKLDSSKEETKTLVKEYFAWEGEFDGKKFNQGKIFK